MKTQNRSIGIALPVSINGWGSTSPRNMVKVCMKDSSNEQNLLSGLVIVQYSLSSKIPLKIMVNINRIMMIAAAKVLRFNKTFPIPDENTLKSTFILRRNKTSFKKGNTNKSAVTRRNVSSKEMDPVEQIMAIEKETTI